MISHRVVVFAAGFLAACLLAQPTASAQHEYQYRFNAINLPPASAREPLIEQFSASKAIAYLDEGAAAWTGERGCVACHTNGMYGLIRPALSKHLQVEVLP